MACFPPLCLRLPAALCLSLAALHPSAWAQVPARAVLEAAPGLQVSYERMGAPDAPTPPGRFDGALATPVGTLRTSVRAQPADERRFQRGDTSFELPVQVLAGQLQLRDREAGGTAAVWRARLGAGLSAQAEGERTPVRTGEALHLRHESGNQVAQGQVSTSTSRAAGAQGTRWDLELARTTSVTRWFAGFDAAERGYVTSSGGTEARTGLRLGTQWLVLPHTRVEARYTRRLQWDAAEPVAAVMLGTRFELPRRASLVTGVEVDTQSNHKASATLTMPLELK